MLSQSNFTVLLGNHEAPIMESWGHNKKFGKKIPLLNWCSGFTNSKSIEFNKSMTWSQWEKVKLFQVVNGWLLSHAGFRENFWRPFATIEGNLESLWDEAVQALRLIQVRQDELLRCGFGRGGDRSWGGAIWCDWDTEFEDVLLPKQLVGHSHLTATVRKIGRSYCIDTGRTYALIYRDGAIKLKNLIYLKTKNEAGETIWVEEEPVIRDDTEHALARTYGTNVNLLSK